MKKTGDRIQAFFTAFGVHTCLIIMLSVSAVHLFNKPIETVEPYVTRIEIGEQVELPPDATMSGEPEPTNPQLPDAGEVTEQPEEAIKPDKDIPEQMLLDPDESPPADITKNPAEGLPGVPTPPRSLEEGILKTFKKARRGPDSEGIPKMFGNPIEGDTVFLLDLSGSMDESYLGSTRLEILKTELINAIELLTEKDTFDILVYSGSYASWDGYCKYLFGYLVEGTADNKEAALAWVKALDADGSTPTYEALKYVCTYYPEGLDNLVLITDGYPNDGTADLIIDEFDEWMERFDNCKFIGICIGDASLGFVKKLAKTVDGVYTVVE